jgi:hypothetical protein
MSANPAMLITTAYGFSIPNSNHQLTASMTKHMLVTWYVRPAESTVNTIIKRMLIGIGADGLVHVHVADPLRVCLRSLAVERGLHNNTYYTCMILITCS